MNQPLEFSGKSVASAVEAACKQLDIPRKKLKYSVISTGTTGIFGIVGRKDARIRVTVSSPSTAQAMEEDKAGILSIVDEAFGQQQKRSPEAKQKPKPVQKSRPNPKPSAPAPSKPLPAEKEETNEGPDSRDEPSQHVRNEPAPEVPDAEPEDTGRWDDSPAPRGEKCNRTPLPPTPVGQASIDLGVETIQKIVDLITEEAHVEAITRENRLTLQISGGNSGILIGRKGQTLDAMQFLADKIINRQSDARVRVKVDIEGYMEARKENLKHLALKMAEKAQKTGRPATINQMSAQDRRIIHLTLKDDPQVRTQSMGDGYYRRLVIFPKKRNNYKGKKRFKK